jgi:thiol-disulfide isomerase/thioredoxin
MMSHALLTLLASALLTATAGSAKESRGSWQNILHAHAGVPTIVHFWGLTCGPCRVEMPQWGKLLRERTDLNLVVIDADLIPNQVEDASEMVAKTGSRARKTGFSLTLSSSACVSRSIQAGEVRFPERY